MPHKVAAIWRSVPADAATVLERRLTAACEQAGAKASVPVFFRADDIAVPGKQFVRLLELFERYRVPLCLSLVPAWLTRTRWQRIQQIGGRAPELWCWHQHGWRHANHEQQNKKQEFGPARPLAQIRSDLARGRRRLESLMDMDFFPVFTPPWNRCSSDTLILLRKLDYRAVSRSRGSLPPPPEGLRDIQINVDLHTRRESTPADGWRLLLDDLTQAVFSGCCGIMIHHRLMNDAAFDFLELLLKTIAGNQNLQPTHFKEMLE